MSLLIGYSIMSGGHLSNYIYTHTSNSKQTQWFVFLCYSLCVYVKTMIKEEKAMNLGGVSDIRRVGRRKERIEIM